MVGNQTKTDTEFYVLKVGMVAALVCTRLPVREATKRLNQQSPTGINSRWSRAAKGRKFTTGEENGVACDEVAGNRHWIYTC
jgi:hypothetical protein